MDTEEKTACKTFTDRAFTYCKEMKPGERHEIAKIPGLDDPEKFIKAVKQSMDWGILKEFHFSNDYRFICRQAEWKLRKYNAPC